MSQKLRLRAFRPLVSEMLESRTVPSSFGNIGFGGGFGAQDRFGGGGPGRGRGGSENDFGSGGNLGVQTALTADNQAIQVAFRTFEQSYQQDVKTILYALDTITASSRAAFDTQVAADLETLNKSIDSAIANITGSSNPTLVAQIEAELLGSDTSSLKTELADIATPSSRTSSSSRVFNWESKSDIADASQTIKQLVASATVPTGTVTTATIQTLKSSIDTAYQSFTQGYLNATETTATNPATNRTAFDAAVQNLVTTLNTNVQAAIVTANLPTSLSTTLSSQVKTDLSGTPTKGMSLQAGLAALGSPSSTNGFAGWYFEVRSRGVIQGSERTVISDILMAVNAYNLALVG